VTSLTTVDEYVMLLAIADEAKVKERSYQQR